MMHEYDCKTCTGTGKEEIDPEAEELLGQPVAVVADVASTPSTKPKPKTISVEPIMKATPTKKK